MFDTDNGMVRLNHSRGRFTLAHPTSLTCCDCTPSHPLSFVRGVWRNGGRSSLKKPPLSRFYLYKNLFALELIEASGCSDYFKAKLESCLIWASRRLIHLMNSAVIFFWLNVQSSKVQPPSFLWYLGLLVVLNASLGCDTFADAPSPESLHVEWQ